MCATNGDLSHKACSAGAGVALARKGCVWIWGVGPKTRQFGSARGDDMHVNT